MKQKTQAICESLHSISEQVDALREIAVDLQQLGVPCLAVSLAADDLHKWRKQTASADDLFDGHAPNTAVGTPHECYNASIDPDAKDALSLGDDGFPADLPRDPYGRLEDPPCVACGAPESVCECTQDDEPPHTDMGAPDETGRIFEFGAYDNIDGTMACHGVDSKMFPSARDQREPDYRCPMCNRFDLGEHLDDMKARDAERKAGWDSTP